jgi:hypothetical protein
MAGKTEKGACLDCFFRGVEPDGEFYEHFRPSTGSGWAIAAAGATRR